MTAQQTDDRFKTDSQQQMTATDDSNLQKNRKIILFCSTQEKRKVLSTQTGGKHTKTNESITIFTCFPDSYKYTFKKNRR